MNFKVYGLKKKGTDQIKYIGITKNTLSQRLNQHLSCCETKKNPKSDWIRSINKEVDIVLIEDCIKTKHDACQKEKAFILLFKSAGSRLKNSTTGGDYFEFTLEHKKRMSEILKKSYKEGRAKPFKGNPLYKMTPSQLKEYKEKHRVLSSGRKHTSQTKAKIRNSNKGKIVSFDTCVKISKAKRGKKTGRIISKEHRDKINEAIKNKDFSGGNNSRARTFYAIQVHNLSYEIYSCISDFTQEYDINKKYVLKSIRKEIGEYKGFIFVDYKEFDKNKLVDIINSRDGLRIVNYKKI